MAATADSAVHLRRGGGRRTGRCAAASTRRKLAAFPTRRPPTPAAEGITPEGGTGWPASPTPAGGETVSISARPASRWTTTSSHLRCLWTAPSARAGRHRIGPPLIQTLRRPVRRAGARCFTAAHAHHRRGHPRESPTEAALHPRAVFELWGQTLNSGQSAIEGGADHVRGRPSPTPATRRDPR